MQIVALEPPGNIARELALYRRSLFASLGEASALAFPELAPLAFASGPRRLDARALGDCWAGIEGRFSSGGLLSSGSRLYLELRGPLGELCARVAAALGEGLASERSSPLDTGLGIFLCSHPDPEFAASEAERIGPPRVDFLDCSLLLLGLRYAGEPFSGLAWRELARSRRRTGALRSVSSRRGSEGRHGAT